MGLITELTIAQKSDAFIEFQTSKKKSIFSVAFLLSGTLLFLMWFAAREIFRAMIGPQGTWVDHLIVGIFYFSLVFYPLVGVIFLAMHRKLRIDSAKMSLILSTCFFGIAVKRKQIQFDAIEKFELHHIQKAKNVAHQYPHLLRFANTGYWAIICTTRPRMREICLDRNTEKVEMVALARYIEKYSPLSVQGLS